MSKLQVTNDEPLEWSVSGRIVLGECYLDGLMVGMEVRGPLARLKGGDLEKIAERLADELAVRWNLRCDKEGVA